MPDPDETNPGPHGVHGSPGPAPGAGTMVAVAQDDDERGRGFFGKLLAAAEGWLGDRQAEAADAVRALHDAVRAGSDALSSRHEQLLSRVFDALARQLERFSTYLAEASLGDLLGDVRDIARKRPKELVAVAFALGFAASRYARHAVSSALGGGAAASRGREATA